MATVPNGLKLSELDKQSGSHNGRQSSSKFSFHSSNFKFLKHHKYVVCKILTFFQFISKNILPDKTKIQDMFFGSRKVKASRKSLSFKF